MKLGLILLILTGTAWAQSGAGPVRVQGSLRTRMEMWEWFLGEANSDYVFFGNILKISLTQDRKAWDWQLELAAPFLLNMPSGSVAPAPQLQLGLGGNYSAANHNRNNDAMLFAKQGWVRWKGLFGQAGQSLKLGRFEFNDAMEWAPKNATLAALRRERMSQRLIGTFAWSNTGRSFDGVHYTAQAGKANFTLVGAIPTRGAFQVDGWGQLKTGFGYLSLNGQLGSGKSQGDWRVLAIYYHDWRDVLKTDSRPLAARRADMGDIRVGTFGGHYLHAWESSGGTFDVVLWGMAQTGRWGRLDHRAWSTDAELGWQPPGMPRVRPWLRAGHTYASGDGDPNDGTHKTFLQLLPTPRPYARTPFYNMMNSEDLYATLAVRPHKDFTARLEAHSLRLANARDLWYQGGGAFQPWTFGFIGRAAGGARSLGNLYDVSADWVFSPSLTVSGYYGYAQGLSAVRQIYPRGQQGHFGYVEFLVRW